MNTIKFLNIYKNDKIIIDKIIKSVKRDINNSDFILGKSVKKFEEIFKTYYKAKYAVSCANGTDALYLAIKSLNLKKNSEIIVPAMTYIATANAVINAGYKIRFSDVNSNGLLNLENVKRIITPLTSACIIVNLYGQKQSDNKLYKFLKSKKISIIEDCAQSHGTMDCLDCKNKNLKDCCFKNLHYSKYASLNCYSFFPGKNLGCYGDGGMILTNKKDLYKLCLRNRVNGAVKKHMHKSIGINSRLDTIQASILLHKIKKLKNENIKRSKIVKKYLNGINNKKIELMKPIKGSSNHIFIIYSKQRKKLANFLKNNGIEIGYHYPKSINKQISFKNYNKYNFANANRIANNSLSIPVCPSLNEKQVNFIINTINNFK